MARDPDKRPGGSPKKRARREAAERGELVPGQHRMEHARESKLSAEVHERIVKFVRAGNFIETAASAAGINRGTMRVWMQRGAREEERIREGGEPLEAEAPYVAFMRDVEQAMGEAEAMDVAAIRRAGTDYKHVTHEYDSDGKATKRVEKTERGDWRALTWRLEHMHGDKYTQRVRLEVESQLNGAIDFLEKSIPPESFRHVIEALAQWSSAKAT